jgi:prefoldin subunit 5
MSSNPVSDVTTTNSKADAVMSSVNTTNTTGNNNSTIQLDNMSLEQLNTIKQREEQRLQALTQRYAALRQAAVRIIAAKTAVQDLYHSNTNDNDSKNDDTNTTTKDVFVPLTESVYVPGKIHIRNNVPSDDDNNDNDDASSLLLIELGTGYYMEQNSIRTINFLDRKLNLVNANSENGRC